MRKFLLVCLLAWCGFCPCRVIAQSRRHIPAHLAKAEPKHGCYFSAFLGPDKSLRVEMFRRGGTLENAFCRIVQKQIAVQWFYFYYHNPRELQAYLTAYRSYPSVLQIALEPKYGLEEVQDNAILHSYAKMIAAYKRPVFLRFASEMNGNWTPYHKNPALYRQKFRLIHDVMARYAPNAVMIWCVGSKPDHNWDAYYPGDKYVDWVGVNFYSVLHHNNDLKQPADKETIASQLDNIYRKFARRKPIAICEYGASRQEKINLKADHSQWAASKLTELFTLLPRKYPRVKMVGLFNVNAITLKFGAARNNFCFTDSPTILPVLRRALASPYYLSRVPDIK